MILILTRYRTSRAIFVAPVTHGQFSSYAISVMVSINADVEQLDHLAITFGCSKGPFPFTSLIGPTLKGC